MWGQARRSKPTGWTSHRPAAWPRRQTCSTTPAVSATGSVLAIACTAVKPPRAAAALREQIGAPPHPVEQEGIDRCLRALRKVLPEEELAAALAAGRAMDWEQAIAFALGAADG